MSKTKQIIIACLIVLSCMVIYNIAFNEAEEVLIKPFFGQPTQVDTDTDITLDGGLDAGFDICRE